MGITHIRLHATELNRNHTLRYILSKGHHLTQGSNSKPVLPIYRRLHQTDQRVKKAERGRDSRDEARCHRDRVSRDKDNSDLIMNRPL